MGKVNLGHDGFGFIGTSGVDVYVDGTFRGGRIRGYATLPFEVTILMLSKPDFDGNLMDDCHEKNAARRAVILETYRKAKENGDQKVWFIDGQTLYGDHDRDDCTTDNTHPNDLGFYRMAEKVLLVMREIFS